VADSQTNVNSDECDPCNCADVYQQYLVLSANCVTNGGTACQEADEKYEKYLACLELVPQCPPGFIFDGCNCYSGVHFPDGYTGFVCNNGFYVKQNCEISTENDCYPEGFEFDGANCHYFGLYFPDGYVGFVWNNAFYTKPGPCVEE